MSRMMAKSRWTQRPSWYCCPGHDPNWYLKGSQRLKEKRQWLAEVDVEIADSSADEGDSDG